MENSNHAPADAWLRRECVVAATLLMASVTIGACAPNAPKSGPVAVTAPPDGAAQLVVFRPSKNIGRAVSPEIVVNDVATCDLRNGRSFVRVIHPGTVSVSADQFGVPGTSQVSFEAEAGRTYYVRVAPNEDKAAAGIFLGFVGSLIAEAASSEKGPYTMAVVDETTAQQEINAKTLQLCDRTATPAGAAPVAPVTATQ